MLYTGDALYRVVHPHAPPNRPAVAVTHHARAKQQLTLKVRRILTAFVWVGYNVCSPEQPAAR